MSQLQVTVNKLNRRSAVPLSLSDNNIIGTVRRGFRFEGTEILNLPNPLLGKWYKDRDGGYYWGGGLIVVDTVSNINTSERVNPDIPGMPQNLPAVYQLGIDISHHNESVDWTSIKNAGIKFAYIKISEGVGT